MPDLERRPPASVMENLVAAASRYEVAVYPSSNSPGLAAAMRAWLLFALERHFREGYYERAESHALFLVGQIDVVDRRADVDVDLTFDAGECPSPDTLEHLFSQIESAPRARP